MAHGTYMPSSIDEKNGTFKEMKEIKYIIRMYYISENRRWGLRRGTGTRLQWILVACLFETYPKINGKPLKVLAGKG